MCSLCGNIPDRLTVDTLHDPERFPEAVARLDVVGGEIWDGQIRRCPECGAYFAYTRDHDSESGVGYGYTDETIDRLWTLDARTDGTWALQSVSSQVTGQTLARVIHDLKTRNDPPIDTITTLSVAANAFGAAPEEIGWLTGLRGLWLRACGLTSLPASIGELRRLTNLSVVGNPLRELPEEILGLPLEQVELQDTQIVTLPEAFLSSSIQLRGFAGNAVPESWRAAYVCEPAYQETLKWFIDRGAECTRFESGAWRHEDRFEVSLSLPAAALPDPQRPFLPEGSPFRVVSSDERSIALEADGRSGTDRIDVERNDR